MRQGFSLDAFEFDTLLANKVGAVINRPLLSEADTDREYNCGIIQREADSLPYNKTYALIKNFKLTALPVLLILYSPVSVALL